MCVEHVVAELAVVKVGMAEVGVAQVGAVEVVVGRGCRPWLYRDEGGNTPTKMECRINGILGPAM